MTDRLCGGFRKLKKEALSKFLKVSTGRGVQVRQWIETDPDLSVRGDWVRSRSSSQVFFLRIPTHNEHFYISCNSFLFTRT